MNANYGLLIGAMLIFVGDAESIRKDTAALQGAWKVIGSEQDGEKVPADDLKDLFLIFKGDAIYIREGGKSEEKFSFKLDPARKPKHIDLTIQFGPNKGKVDRAIYELDGSRLRICIQSSKDAPRPSDFSTKSSGKLWLVVMERTKD
jgi:uncharacterized protein (TIGR03067 family)